MMRCDVLEGLRVKVNTHHGLQVHKEWIPCEDGGCRSQNEAQQVCLLSGGGGIPQTHGE